MAHRPFKAPSYLKHSSGQARIRVRGKDTYLGVYGSAESLAEYNRIIAELQAAHSGGVTPARAGTKSTVAKLAKAYLEAVGTRYSGQQTKRIKRALGYVVGMHGEKAADDFSIVDLETVRAQIVKEDRSRKYVNALIGCIKRVWKWGVQRKYCQGATFAELAALDGLRLGELAVREMPRVPPVPVEHVEATLPHLRAPVAAMIRLQMLAGMRPGEVLALKPGQIERGEGLWIYRPEKNKNSWRDQTRTVYLGPQAMAILLPFMDRAADAYCFSPKEGGRASKLHRDHYDNQTYPRAVARAIAAANTTKACADCKKVKPENRCAACKAQAIPAWHPNQCRHTVGTRVRAMGGPDAARTVLGQKSLKATEIYAERDEATAAEIMRKIG